MQVVMNRRQKRIYRACLLGALVGVLVMTMMFWYWQIERMVPNEILLFENQAEDLYFRVPFMQVSMKQKDNQAMQVSMVQGGKSGENIRFSMAEPISMRVGGIGSFRAEVRLFGWLHCKDIRFDVMKEARVMPVGSAVGLYIHADGMMVLGTGKVSGKDGVERAPSYEILQTGDYIYEVNGQTVATIQDVSNCIQKNGAKKLVLGVVRGSNRIKVRVLPVLADNGNYQIGVWLREDTEGIGTLTFVTERDQFAALGHGITDADTGLLIKLQNGGLYSAGIDHVVPGEAGAPGELVGSVKLGRSNRLGTIANNTSLGITGNITSEDYSYREEQSLPLGRKQEVREGQAYILCQLGDQVKEYQVEIERINVASKDNKGMEIHVTDPELLQEAGGIVQGMSGAPLIQDDKCIGAVTHVFVKDVTRGYATFIENML